jgi:EAL domain-containing protein (putative c-di-GMP-specific phosphodiesterase class I)
VVAFVVIAAAGWAARSLLSSSLYRSAERNAIENTRLLVSLGFAAALGDGRLTLVDRRSAARQLQAFQHSHAITALAVWSASGRIEMAAGDTPRGPIAQMPRRVRRAFESGRVQAGAEIAPGGGQTLQIAVPRTAAGRRFVVETHFARSQLLAELRAANRRLYLYVGGGALLFYAAILPLVGRWVRRMPAPLEPAARRLLGEFRSGLERGELRVHYQPKVRTESGEVVGVEALVRWEHPQRGLLGPGQFLPVVEQDEPLLRALTEHVVDIAVRDCARWRRSGCDLSVAVNIPGAMLGDDGLGGTVRSALRHHGLSPHHLVLEITETAIMNRTEEALALLDQLRATGVAISIDDFGTGHSSLARLRTLPADELKLDREFTRRIAHDRRDLALMRLIVGIATNFGLRIVAEGVEDEETRALLAELGCDLAQGYLFSRPVPEPELVASLNSGSGRRLLPAGDVAA